MIPNNPPNLPLPPAEYDPRWAEDVLRQLRLYFDQFNKIAPATFTTLRLTNLTGASSLVSAVNSTQTTLTLASTEQFPVQGSGTVDQEKFSWTGKSGNTLTGVTRGILGTIADAHPIQSVVVASAVPGAVYANPTNLALYVVF